MKLRSLWETVVAADSVRALTESGPHLSLLNALSDFASGVEGVDWALIGGLAVGFRARPRGTQDIDVLIAGDREIDLIVGRLQPTFKQIRPHTLEHKPTGVEIELITPELVNMDPKLFQTVLDCTTLEDMKGQQIPVATAESLIALKLGRGNRRDLGDIEDIIRQHGPLDMSKYALPSKKLSIYNEIVREMESL